MKLLYLTAVIAALTSSLWAGTDHSKTVVTTTSPPTDGWKFRFAPYAWVIAIDGDVRIGPLIAPVDISMEDTLDSLDMAYMGIIEASHGRWALGLDTVYGKASQDIGGGGIFFRSFSTELEQWILTPSVAYRVIDNPGYHMDVLAGARITILEAEVTGRFVGGGELVAGREKSWVDPIIGIRGQADIGNRCFFRYNGDIGGFGAGSDLIWQAFAGIGYNCNESVSVAVGYRAIGIDYEQDRFALDTVSHGPVIGLEVRW